jgi:hypothetical protein
MTLLVSSSALAQLNLADHPPFLMVILDSSGSMSYVETELTTPLCSDDAAVAAAGNDPALARDASATYTFSRDMIAKEVLTGTFNTFWCRERQRPTGRFDEGYPVPWFTPEYSSQTVDGIIDVNRERVKFGFMAFDTNLLPEDDVTGNWSLGPSGQGVSGVSATTNLGGMNDQAPNGALVIPAPNDDPVSITDNNAAVQQQVLAAVPYGGTPIGPALSDVAWLFKNHGSLVAKTGGNQGDPYAACRPKNILLITDGRPNMGEGELGYDTSVEAAEKLYQAGYKTYVIGFNLDAGISTLVDDIANAGGTSKAHLATSAAELSTALSEILGLANPGLHSRTDTVFTNLTYSNSDLQYQVNTAYSSALRSDIDYAGHIEVTSYRCTEACQDAGGGAGACEVTQVHKLLQDRATPRNLQFAYDGKLYPFSKSSNELMDDDKNVFAIPTTGTLPNLAPNQDSYGVRRSKLTPVWDATEPAQRKAYREQLIELVSADSNSRRKNERLGGVWHSTPVIQTNLSSIDTRIASFQAYQAKIQNRPTVMFTQTHEGFIHAFLLSQPFGGTAANPGTPSGAKWLEEIWAIAPQHAVRRMKELGTKRLELTDGRMVLKDIRLARSNAATTAAQVSAEVDQWRSVLVAPYRQGGRGMIAIDVTNPYKPFVRWEIDNTRRCYLDSASIYTCKDAASGDENDYSNLGFTHGKPVVGTVFIDNPDGVGQIEVAAAFYGCGDAEGLVGDNVGKCFMVTRLDDGRKLKEFSNPKNNIVDNNTAPDNTLNALDFTVVGDPAAYNTFIGNFVTRLFVGDSGGQLWRIDTSAVDPDDWTMQFFFDIYKDLADEGVVDDGSISSQYRTPLKTAPSMSPLPQRGTLALSFGSGDLDYATDLSQIAVMYSLRETVTLDSAGSVGDVGASVNWRRVLNSGETLTSKPIIFGNITYFTSYQPNALDACNVGTGRIWGLDFLNGDADKKPIPKFELTDSSGDKKTAEYQELENSIPYGATIINRPSCAGTSGVGGAANAGALAGAPGSAGNSALNQAKPGKLELVVQTGSVGQTNGAATPKGSTTANINRFAKELTRPPVQVIGVSWGQVQSL